MAFLELGGRRFPIPLGDVVIGSDAAAGLRVAGPGVLPTHALVRAQPDGQVAIRKGTPAAEISVNGVRLGAEPTPLLHGDKVQIGTQELTFVDERRSGSTQYIAAMPAMVRPDPKGPRGTGAGGGPAPSTTANTGGRIVSLTDGREYVITGASLVFGREAGSDVVVAGKDASRRHAEIVQTPKGYLLVDSSTNGTFVNDERVTGQRLLVRADVVRIGEESFRFYADVAPDASAPVPVPPRAAPPAASPAPPPAPAAPRGSERLRPTTMEPAARLPVPPAAAVQPAPGPAPRAPSGASSGPGRPSQTGPFATLLVTGGTLKGQRHPVRTPLVNIGRADYNDLVLADPSVSTAHAKLQRREGVFFLVDLDSTNGSYVDGERVQGETAIGPGASLRFGDVPLLFEPTDDALGVEKGGGTVVLSSYAPVPGPGRPKSPVSGPPPSSRPSPPPAAPPPPSRAPEPPKPGPKETPSPQLAEKGKGCGAAVLVVLMSGGAVAAVLRWILG